MQIPGSAIFAINTPEQFEELALATFRHQIATVPVYQTFCELLGVSENQVTSLEQIPFLPIQFFKTHTVLATGKHTELLFKSSGTTGSQPSQHHVADKTLYEASFNAAFSKSYGAPTEYTILALLPSYLERGDSSLVYMVHHLIDASQSEHSGFYLDNYDALIEKIHYLEARGMPTLLIGVSYALLDLIEKQSFSLRTTTVMETGGMKGRRKELVRSELHQKLTEGFGVAQIHSEYGMTELLSQAYSTGNGIFNPPPWMRVLTRETEDPFAYVEGRNGGINVIDLANQHSCAFIATQDLGKVYKDQSFEVLGRFDHSDVRGCNLMVV